MAKPHEVELRGNTKQYRAEFGKSIQTNQAFTQSLKGLAQGTDAIDSPLGAVSGRISALNGLCSSGNLALVGFGAGLAAITATAYQSIKVFDTYERQQLRTEALVRATGNAAGFTAEQLAHQADEVALNTLASVGGIVEAQGVLLTFKSVSGDTFKQAIRLSQDMAATFGGSARDKALQLGKALEDPTNGLNALKRSGVSFTETERDMIVAMQEAGNIGEAQRVILEKLDSQIGGSGSAEAGGLSGAVDTLGQRWDELMLSFSKSGAGEEATSILNTLAKGVHNLNEKMFGLPDGDRKYQTMMRERAELMAEVQKGMGDRSFNELPSFNPFGYDKNQWYNDQRRLSELYTHLERMDNKKKAQKAAQEAARKQEEARREEYLRNRKKKEQEAADKRRAAAKKAAAEALKRQQEQSARSLSRLKQQQATEDEQIQLAHNKRKQDIQNLVLSQAQIEAEGFSDLLALKAHLYAKEDKLHQKRLDKYKAKLEAQRTAAAEQQQKMATLQGDRFETDVNNALSEQKGQLSGLERFLGVSEPSYQEQLDTVKEATRQSLKDIEAMNIDHQAKQAMIGEVQKRSATKQAELESKSRQQAYGDMFSAMETLGTSGSKKLFAISKAANIGKAVMNTYMAASNALASVPYPFNFAAAATISAAGMVQVANIQAQEFQGQAHDGLRRVPASNEGTYLLRKDEMVLNPKQTDNFEHLLHATRNTAQSVQASSMPNQASITQHITVTGNGDDALRNAVAQGAKQGAEQGYASVIKDLRSNGPIKKLTRR